MQVSIVLTVAEGKRLIAKGLVNADFFRRALDDATVAVCKGSTNAYLVEEILGEPIEKRSYMTGKTVPAKPTCDTNTSGSMPDLVISKGERISGGRAIDALKDMGPGDCFVKGANALNLERRQAALLIGHPTGGTIGAALGTVTARRIRLVIPVGLEKSVPTDLVALSQATKESPARKGTPAVWPLCGDIFTEIEALRSLTGVQATPMAAGGLAGAEGAVMLLISGTAERIDETLELIDGIYGEPPFISGPNDA